MALEEYLKGQWQSWADRVMPLYKANIFYDDLFPLYQRISVDADRISIDAAVQLVRAWTNGSQVQVLNVAGPRDSKDLKVYGTTKRLLTVLIKMMSLGSREKQEPPG